MTSLKNNLKRNLNSNSKLKSSSPYGQKLRESKKISLFYGGLSKKYLQKINYKNLNLPSKLSENMFIILESRLDVVLYRSGFFESIKSAKQMIRIGGIKVNNKIVISPGFFVTPGDILSVFGKNNKNKLCYNFEKTKALPQKSVFFVNRRYLKKTSQNMVTSSKEKIDLCRTFVKMKNQKSTRKEIASRYKGSLMLLSIISFVYSQMLKVYNKNISDFTTTTSNISLDQSFATIQGQSVVKLGSETKAKPSTIVELIRGDVLSSRQSLDSALATSTFFGKNKSYNFSENNLLSKIEKDNGYGLCLVFINTIKNLIDLKDSKSLPNNYHHQTQKLTAFFTRLIAFNNEIKINNLFTYILSSLTTKRLLKAIYFAKNPTFDSAIDKTYCSTNAFSIREATSRGDKEVSKKQVDHLFMFLNYLLNLKKQYLSLQKKKTNHKKQQQSLFYKNQSFFEMKKTKAPHLEISYKSLSIVFLFPPQRVNFPSFLNPSLIYK